ncbi:MAG: hypothetical protein ABI488_03765 [Polyangiaceae bacterium]
MRGVIGAICERKSAMKILFAIPFFAERAPERLSRSRIMSSPISMLFLAGPAVLRARWYLRGATRVGSKVRIWGSPEISNSETLLIGDRVRIVSTTATTEIGVNAGGTLEIGDNVYINVGCSIAATESIRIGKTAASAATRSSP